MRTRLIVSAVFAMVGAIVGTQLVQRGGDPSAAIEQFEDALNTTFQERLVLPIGGLVDPAIKKYVISDPDGRVLQVERGIVPNETELESLFALVASRSQVSRSQLPQGLQGTVGGVRQVKPGWNDLPPLWQSFTFSNQRIAEGRAALRYESRPSSLNEYTWNQRFEAAARPWELEEPQAHRLRVAVFGVAGAAGSFVVVFVSLLLASLAWGFLLERIRELSNAFRGKRAG